MTGLRLPNALVVAVQPWLAYTPVWTAPTTNPAKGNGTIAGTYLQVGKTVYVAIEILMGTTTTYGTGTWAISLPATPRSGSPTMTVSGAMQAAGVNRQTLVGTVDAATSTLARLWNGQATTGGTGLGATSFAWAAGDFLRLTGVYEAA